MTRLIDSLIGPAKAKPSPLDFLKAKVRTPQQALMALREAQWREKLGNQGSITTARPAWGEKLENAVASTLRAAGVENRRANRLANRTTGGLNDFTPVGNITGAQEGARDVANGMSRGDLKQAVLGAGVFGLSMLPFAGPAKRKGGDILRQVLKNEDGAIRAWHGSPYDFDQFDASKIGTGEGNQAYGRGLYLADRPGVAGSYVQPRGTEPLAVAPEIRGRLKDALAKDDYLGFDSLGEAVHAVRTNPTDFDKAWEVTDAAEVRAALDAYDNARWPQGKRPRLYEVEIDAGPEDFVDWDTLGATNAQRAASDPGVKGIKYLDGNSRGQGSGSYNYVVTDPSLLKILGKY